jgi:hypothetical protein
MKKIISILICIQITLFPAFAFASNVGGWTLGGGIAQGASVVYNGTKQVIIDGKDYIKKGTAKITPPASGVAKVLARGAAGYALSIAVEQLLGSVDWVLDPANNQIRYREKEVPPTQDPTLKFLYSGAYNVTYSPKLATANAVCSYLTSDPVFKQQNTPFTGSYSVQLTYTDPKGVPSYTCFFAMSNGGSYSVGLTTTANPIYDPNAEKDNEEKTIPLETVAQQVISNAQGGDVNAQVATTAAAADIVAEAEKDEAKARPIVQQLEASAQTKPADEAAADKANEATGEQTKNPDKPDTTDLKLTFPIFCNWAPLVCEAAQTVISFPTTLTDWWNTTNQKADSWASSIAEAWASVKEWATGEPDLTQDQTDLPIEEQTIDRDPSSFDTDYIVLGSQCPTFEPYTVEVGPVSKTLSMDLSPLCDFAAKVRPAILGMSYLTAAGIVVAAIRET